MRPKRGSLAQQGARRGYSTWIRFGMLVASLVALLVLWQLLLVDRQVDLDQARRIALAHARSSPHLGNIDTTRVSIALQEDQAYVVDFAWIGADQIRPGLWTVGYLVVVEARSGDVTEAHAYER